MKISSMLLQLLSLLCLVPHFVQSTTILVDGVSEWQDPSVHVGDTVSGGGGATCRRTDWSILRCNSFAVKTGEAEAELKFV
ncbi:Cupredoxin superfamily protein isoform 3 [Tripterygium wilfordii]|uniref:Cupredoxin superfamily protein isoform 3 n=1 Tax=Tripterygium wilfordii TaxID=458696 RepID=A0A7J7CMU2_TRIWF|nr:Cupredoxin superfamily protein isoform 3 [Tripterygium wilfordii]